MERQPQRSSTDRLLFQQLLEHNHLAIIENPLRRIPEGHLYGYIKLFYDEAGLANVVDFDTLFRAARLAGDEEAFVAEEEAEQTLTQVERTALKREKATTIWTESREIKIILLTCFVGSVLQGWAQGAVIGPNQIWPKDLGLDLGERYDGPNEPKGQGRVGDIWKFSATNAIVYFAASSVGSFLCDPFTEIFVGRRGAIFAAALITFTASIGEGFVHHWQALFACRFLVGIGMGAKSSVIPVYESEISPARLRGQILTSWQTGTALGLAISGVIPLLVFDNWRFQISSSFIPAFALLLLVFVGSESPRWLIKKQRYSEAFTVLSRLQENPLLAARDLVFVWAQLQVETTLFMRTNNDIRDLEHQIPHLDQQVYLRQINFRGYARRITQLFTIPRVRRATVASFIVMSAQQMAGVNVFAFLASTLFATGPVGRPDRGGLWLFFGFGIANFLSSAVAYFYIDRKGRRWLLMVSLTLMFPLLLATAFSFEADSWRGPVTVFLILYTMAYSPGAGAVPFLYSSEIFPQVLREVGMAWASAVCWTGAGILDLCVPALIKSLDQTRVLCIFASLDALALVLVWLFVPGTERQIATMEEMNYVFGVSTVRHVEYQVKEVLPWCIDHYIRREKDVELDPLYRYARARNGDDGETDCKATGVEMNEGKEDGEVHEMENVRTERREG